MKNKDKNKKKNNIISFPNSISKLERQVEAILFAASEPLDIETIEKRVKTNSDLEKILEKIKSNYKNRGINLVCIKNRWSFRTAEDLSKLMSLQKSTQKKLSKAAVETLAIKIFKEQHNLDMRLRRKKIDTMIRLNFSSIKNSWDYIDFLHELDSIYDK